MKDRSEIQTGTRAGVSSQRAQQADHNGTGPTGKLLQTHLGMTIKDHYYNDYIIIIIMSSKFI